MCQSFSRSYGRFIAEFLREDSPDRLGLLDLPTSVGLRYGRLSSSSTRFFLAARLVGIHPQLPGDILHNASALAPARDLPPAVLTYALGPTSIHGPRLPCGVPP